MVSIATNTADITYRVHSNRGKRCSRRLAGINVEGVGVCAVAERQLTQLDAAQTLEFLRAPPGNRLEGLRGDRAGQYSIRINDQWRVCFTWTDNGPADVEIVDYH